MDNILGVNGFIALLEKEVVKRSKTLLYVLNSDELLRKSTSFDTNQCTITVNNIRLQLDDLV